MSLYKGVKWKERDVCVRITVNIGRMDVCCRCYSADMETPYIILSLHGILELTITKQAHCKVQTAGNKCKENISVKEFPPLYNSKN